MVHDINASAPRGGDRFHDPRATVAIVRRAEFPIIHRNYKRLRDEVKMFAAFRVLHLLDVLGEAILASELIRSENVRQNVKLIQSEKVRQTAKLIRSEKVRQTAKPRSK